MDELTAALATSFSVSKELNTTAAEHPRFSQYKLKLSPSQRQEARRKKILDIQKKVREDKVALAPRPSTRLCLSDQGCESGRRFDFTSHARNLTEGVWEEGEYEEENVEKQREEGGAAGDGHGEEEMEVQTSLRKPGRYYKDQLMYSEWLVEVPDDFEQEWLLVVCPTGKRRLVVSARGQTTSYSKGGFRCNTFLSHLPGGSRIGGNRSVYGESVILDCVFCEKLKTYYVLDMMYWKNMPIYDSETEFRFYWLHEKLQEIPSLSVIKKSNQYAFIPLPSFPCNAVTISNAISCANFDIDGLLFYHKRTHYTFGPTPLVVWLKTYMVPDVLNIAVPYKEVCKAPPSYSNYAKHLDSVKDEKYGSREETGRPPSARRGRGGRGRGRGRGRGQNRQERNMDSSEVVESSPDTSLNFSALSSASDATPTKPAGRGILQMAKSFNFSPSATSPFAISSSEQSPVQQVNSDQDQAQELKEEEGENKGEISESMSAGGDNTVKDPSQSNGSGKKSKNRGKKARASKMDTQ